MPDWIFLGPRPIRMFRMAEFVKAVGRINGMRMRVIVKGERAVAEMKDKDDFDDDFQEGMS